MANSSDPDQTLHSVGSDLDLHCLLRHNWMFREKLLTVFIFQIGWYNEQVTEKFILPYEYDTLAILLVSTPDMFDKALIPFLVREECSGTGDLIDKCIKEYFNQIKQVSLIIIFIAPDKVHFYAPNFKEVGGAYCFWVVRPSVRPSFRPSVRPSVRHAFWCIA